MKTVLNESEILHRMTREETANVNGGGVGPTLPSSLCSSPQGSLCNTPVGSLCIKPVDSLCITPPTHPVCGCLLADCGCTPSQTDCHQCAAGSDPVGM